MLRPIAQDALSLTFLYTLAMLVHHFKDFVFNGRPDRGFVFASVTRYL